MAEAHSLAPDPLFRFPLSAFRFSPGLAPRADMVAGESPAPSDHGLGGRVAEGPSASPSHGSHETSGAAAPPPPPTAGELAEGSRRAALVLQARALRAQGAGWAQTAKALGTPLTTLYRWCQQAAGVDVPAAEQLAPRTAPGPAPKLRWTSQEVASVRALHLVSNRTAEAGSAEEAARRAMAEGGIRPDLAQALQARAEEGKPMLTEHLRRAVALSPATVRSFRNPREAWLDFVHSPGSLMLTKDPVTGEEREWRPGEAWTLDDGTINLVCCVPTGDPRWRHGVMPGRFQFLLVVDHRSYFIPGFCYTARPRGSYRAEDLVATLGITIAEHGAPRVMILEKGISAADLVSRCLRGLGVEILRANSPHQKVVEFVFNVLWTKLSFLPGQVGRYRGEEAEVTALLDSCRQHGRDPRQHFPMLADVLREIRAAIAQWNAHPVNGSRWGQWQPAEFWSRIAPAELRRIPPQDHWLFAPHVTGALKVRGLQVATQVLMMPGFSQQFTFANAVHDQWLVDWVGARVHLHFNPFAPAGAAMAVLATDWRGRRAGTPLGPLVLVDRQAKRTRRLWGYSAEEDDGAESARRQAQALYRSAQAIRPDGKPAVAAVEARDGLGAALEVRTAGSGPAAGAPARGRGLDREEAAPDWGGRRVVLEPECCPASEDPELAGLLED